jgi:hypothetical protein
MLRAVLTSLLGFKKAVSLLLGILGVTILSCGAFDVVSLHWMVKEAASLLLGGTTDCFFFASVPLMVPEAAFPLWNSLTVFLFRGSFRFGGCLFIFRS